MTSLSFYLKVLKKIALGFFKSKRGKFTYKDLIHEGLSILELLKQMGCPIIIQGKENLKEADSTCVFVANHMSTLETFVLPAVLGEKFRVTFVVKDSLLRYPFFNEILKTLKPIAVTRRNPKEDYKVVMQEGVKRIKDGVSVVVFPQATREIIFNPDKFNTLGVKLAQKADVQLIPIALRTDAWAVGKIFKDFGRIDPTKPICFFIGRPIKIEGKGIKEHLQIIDFIRQSLAKCYN
ncbi:MAG: 1-acyl-sn-glycerol-3-phosphate acyltransferase [Thermodesulfovibrio sp.]|nr:1-acyl-sn-glycerol-3-phosphate acyltransferase [Thermodesulfovibrio sp.]